MSIKEKKIKKRKQPDVKKKAKKSKFVKFSKGLYMHLKTDDKCYRQRYRKPHKKSV